jgi:hypothetical protein
MKQQDLLIQPEGRPAPDRGGVFPMEVILTVCPETAAEGGLPATRKVVRKGGFCRTILPLAQVALLFLFYIHSASAATITAQSCDLADVQAAISAAADGDTVAIPAGTSAWAAQLVVNAGKNLTIQGAGIDQTIIIDEVPKDGSPESTLMIVNTVAGKSFRLTGITFSGGSQMDRSIWAKGVLVIGGNSKAWRVDHVRFDEPRTIAMRVYGDTYGVIDHSIFDLSTPAINVFHDTWGGAAYGDGSWADATDLGTKKAVYIEDNVFNRTPSGEFVIDSFGGGRFVARYNTFNGASSASHGTESGGRLRSIRSYEIYNNTFTHLPEWGFTAVFLRGGTGVIWSNTISGFQTGVLAANYRDVDSFRPWGACDGSSPYDKNDGIIYDSGNHNGPRDAKVLTAGKTWTPDQWKGYSLRNTTKDWGTYIVSNTSNTISVRASNYGRDYTWTPGDRFEILRASVAIDQVGRGKGALLSGEQPLPQAWPEQLSEPVYVWGNVMTKAHNGREAGSNHPRVQVGRDIIIGTPKPGYVPYVYPHPLVTAAAEPNRSEEAPERKAAPRKK